jgi:hypothetical protein
MSRYVTSIVMLTGVLIAAASLSTDCRNRSVPSAVPTSYACLYRALDSQLGRFGKKVRRVSARRKSAPIFGAHLLVADSNRGPALLAPETLPGVEITLDRLQELGIKGITLAIGYPLLTSDFPNAGSYVAFYQSVAQAVQRRGMTLAVEQIILFVNSQFSPWQIDFSSLTLARFTDEQRQMAQTIIDEIAPDYLTILHEPDTYAVLTGLEEFHTPNLATAYVTALLADLRRGNTLVGAGAVNYNDLAYYSGFARTAVDYLDVHVYNVAPRSVRNTLKIARIARRNHKPLVMSEAWLYKTDGADMAAQANLIGWGEGFRRDVFSFWAPLDVRFHDVLTRFAQRAGVAYASPFWANYYFAYLDYTPAIADLSYQVLATQLAPAAVADAIVRDAFTQTGLRYREDIARPGWLPRTLR